MGGRGAPRGGRALERKLTPRRSGIYRATVPTNDGEARKIVVVVSRDSINASGMNAIVARVTATERLRAFPSVVTVEPERQTGLSMRSFILCHDLLTIDPDTLDPRPLGKILEVEDRLRYALDL